MPHFILGVLDRTFGERGLLPARFDSPNVRHQLIAISGQEADLRHRWQVVDAAHPERKGPARGLWQFELGSRVTCSGVTGVYWHRSSMKWLDVACRRAGVAFTPRAIWQALEDHDELACAVARCLLLTDPRPIPNTGDVWGGWDCYHRNWNPGAPHPDAWPDNHARATRILREGAAG
jgi:hypothetical protein